MANPTQIRQASKFYAKSALAANFGSCIAVSLIVTAISYLAAFVSSFPGVTADELIAAEDVLVLLPNILTSNGISLLFGILISPITIGTYYYYINLARGRKLKITEIFVWFGDVSLFGKAIGATLWHMLLTLFWLVIAMILPLSLLLLLTVLPISNILYTSIAAFASLLFVIASVLALVKVQSYTPALYLLAADPSLTVMDAFRMNNMMMRGHIWEFFIVQISFILWNTLAAFTCGLSVFYVTPYITLTNCYFILQRAAEYRREHGLAPDTPDNIQEQNNSSADTE